MGSLLLRLRTWWETADRTQRVVTIFGGAFLAALLLGTFYFASKPKMELAFSGLSYSEIAAVKEEIDKRGIPAEYGQNGSILLPRDKILEVKAALAQANKLPMSNNSASSELEKVSITTTPTVEQARLKLMLENDIAASIQFIEGVQSARVKITPGDTSPLMNESLPPTASVAIVEKSGMGLTPEQAKAIARLVAYSVPGLDVKHVTIVNQAGVQLYDGQSAESAGMSAENKLTAEVNESKRRERELQSMLDAVFGPNSTVAKVTLSLDFDQKSTRVTTPIVGDPVSVAKYEEKMQGDRPLGSAPIGAPATAPGGDPNGRRYDGLKNLTEYARGESVESKESALGTVTGMKITIAVNQDKQLDVAKIEEMARNYLPAQPDGDKFNVVVTEVPFDTTAQKEAEKAASASAMSSRIQQGLSILPVVALIVVGLMVVKAIARAAKEQTVLVQALPDGRMMPIEAGALGSGASDSTEIVSAEGAGNETQLHPPAQLKPPLEIGQIEQKVDITHEQIKRMAAEKPEAVALLIKSWLLETKR